MFFKHHNYQTNHGLAQLPHPPSVKGIGHSHSFQSSISTDTQSSDRFKARNKQFPSVSQATITQSTYQKLFPVLRPPQQQQRFIAISAGNVQNY